ncbi:MAG: PRC-barrel domain-containing protein [Candidatus Kerfeldbacteria bacterium]|nr:PRC-barrel domain-containing protein [Candidatus Kerfeldbacteria bacterium]
MSLISLKQLHHALVVTESGHRLGRVVDVELDAEAHLVTTYLVSPSRLVQPLTRSVLRIHRSQVVSVSPEKLVVQDSVKPLGGEAEPGRPSLPKNVAPAVPARSG